MHGTPARKKRVKREGVVDVKGGKCGRVAPQRGEVNSDEVNF